MFRPVICFNIRPLLFALLGIALPLAVSGYGEPVEQVIQRLRRGGNSHEGGTAAFAREIGARSPGDAPKIAAAVDGVKIAAAILSTRDLSVPVDRRLRTEPDFDWKKYGAKPPFAGADPESIEDPALRAAYKAALEKHYEQLIKSLPEQQKDRDAKYVVDCILRIVALTANKEEARKAVAQTIDGLADAEWIKAHLRAKLLTAPTPPQRIPAPGPIRP